MAYLNPGKPSQPSLQILGCCVHSLLTTNPATGVVTTISDLAETRRICYELQKPVVKPEHVYAHVWEEGDQGVSQLASGAILAPRVKPIDRFDVSQTSIHTLNFFRINYLYRCR